MVQHTVVLMMMSGQEIIGDVDEEDMIEEDNPIEVTINGPMTIVSDGTGSLRLHDMLLLSDDTQITVDFQHVMAVYLPSDVMKEYYLAAREFASTHTRASISQQIKESTAAMRDKLASIAELRKSAKEQAKQSPYSDRPDLPQWLFDLFDETIKRTKH